ncbi:metallophosphoesterase [Deinococcus navajonensis]|uniref:Metallophosphoesterase n=1 Tax=Deinococcus navajonensis TaxID=309884 RepID=A0ABV8XQY3_9DEIO
MTSLASSVTRRRVLKLLGSATAAAGLLGTAGAAQTYRFGVTREQRTVAGLRSPLRVAFLTDLHYGPFMRAGSVSAWVQATNAERPDLVLLGGDYLDVEPGHDVQPLLNELRELRAPLGVYGVWGNHDYGSFGEGRRGLDWTVYREALRRAFAGVGIKVLRNENRAVREDLDVAGLDDLTRGEPDVAATLRPAAGPPRATLLLSHNPDVLPELPQGVGLVLCGHTHGGQVRLPLLGAPLVPSRYGQRYAMGWVRGAHDTPAYVSRGLGVTGVPLRVLCEPELTLLTLTPEEP